MSSSLLLLTFFQMFFPGLIILFVWLIPESPRWLYVHNKREKSKDVLTKWHGYGNPESPWVSLQIQEYEEFLNLNGAVCRPALSWNRRIVLTKLPGQTLLGLPRTLP